MHIHYVHVDANWIARSFSFLWIKRIYMGRGFERLSMEARAAVFAHERYHLMRHHTEWRALAMLLVLPMLFMRRICHAQEFAADRFAAGLGFRKGLLQAIATDSAESLMHPSHAARRAALKNSSGSRKGPIALSA